MAVALTRNVHSDLQYALRVRAAERAAGYPLTDEERRAIWQQLREPGKSPDERVEDPHA